MIAGAIDLARLFLDGYQTSKDQKAAIQRIREAIEVTCVMEELSEYSAGSSWAFISEID